MAQTANHANRPDRKPTITVQVTITPNGRMSLPAVIRKRLGLAGGGALLIEETEDGLILRTPAQAIAHA
jgi:AbrB family looped-hinge helix DNA binding protein